MHRGNFFNEILKSMKYLKSCLPKGNMLKEKGNYYFINIYIVYPNRAFILMKLVFFNLSVIECYNFFIHFYIWF